MMRLSPIWLVPFSANNLVTLYFEEGFQQKHYLRKGKPRPAFPFTFGKIWKIYQFTIICNRLL